MPSLNFATALTAIEQAIHRVIRWNLLKLAATVADIPALRTYATQSNGANATPPFTPVFVTSAGVRYEWSRSSVAADDGVNTIQPTDVPAGQPGRWLVTASTVTTGYLAAVNYWQGETRKKEFQSRILAARPSVAILWESSDNDPRSTIPGAIYDYPCRFSIWCVDQNLRPDYEAFFGSGYGYDSDHPGAIQILGDVKQLLASENKRRVGQSAPNDGILGLSGGAKIIQIGGEDVEDADLAERVMVLSLGVTVIGSIENPDTAAEHVAVTSVYVTPNLTDLNAQTTFDLNNYVASGYLFSPQSGFAQAPTSGSAVIAGTAVSSAPASHTFSAQSDTYCDLKPDGTIAYIAEVNGGATPTVTTGALRLGRVVTDSLGIVRYEPIAATSAPIRSNDPDRVIPKPSIA